MGVKEKVLTNIGLSRYNNFCLFGVIFMHLHFRKVAQHDGPVIIRETLDVSSMITHRKDITAVSPLEVDLSASMVGESLMELKGTLSAELDTQCSRCLKEVHQHLNIPFEERFRSVVGEAELEEDEEDATIPVEGEAFDTVPFCEESFVIHLPFTPLCSEECKGLCPTCGQDWNEGSCDCDNTRVDPRLAALKNLFK